MKKFIFLILLICPLIMGFSWNLADPDADSLMMWDDSDTGDELQWTVFLGDFADFSGTNIVAHANVEGLADGFLRLTALSAEPTEVIKDFYVADCESGGWEPSGCSGTNDTLFLCTAADTYKPIMDLETGEQFISGIDMRGGTFTADQKHVTYSGNDTISTDEAYGYTMFITAAAEIEMPAVVDGMFFCVENHTAGDVNLDPNGSEVIRIDGVALDAGDSIVGTDLGDMACCGYYAADTWSCMTAGYEDAGD